MGQKYKKPEHIIRVLQIGFVGIVGMALLYFASETFWHILVANVLCGLGGSAISIGWQSFSMGIPEYRTEDLSALHLTTCGARGVYAPILGALFIDIIDLRTTFIIASSLVIVGIFIAEIARRYVGESFSL